MIHGHPFGSTNVVKTVHGHPFGCLIFTKTLLFVSSDSASGCCAYWYGATNDCSLCTSSGICRDSIGNSISGPYTSTDGSTDCISYTVSEADCETNGGTFLQPSDNNGFGCPANTSDFTMASCTISSYFETPSGDYSMPSECVAGATIPHGFECTLTCPTGSHVVGTQPSCMNGAFFGTVGCMDDSHDAAGATMCSTYSPCPYDSFCNFDYGNSGFCESCSPYRNSNQTLVDLACGSDTLPDSGVSDCKNKCLSSPASILTGRLGLISASVVAFVLV